MKKLMLTAATAAMLAASPAMAANLNRTSAPANETSHVESTPLLAAAAVAAFILAIVLIADDDDDDEPVSG